ncbi:MAG: DoxX family protein [Candidatus Neomarinimicrobiota bacterium]|nr:DoxX family protein [Candidatus Neomarinimicrobiota bacterium]
MIEIFQIEINLINIVQSLIGLFLSVALLQSGSNKIIERKSNLEWLSNHFSDSPLHGFVPSLLNVITVLEIFAGSFTLSGSFVNFVNGNNLLLTIGLLIAALNFLALFLGQRIAKDYEGAAVLVNYFILNILGLLSLAH